MRHVRKPAPKVPVQVLIADPPWKFGDKVQGERGAEHKYPCMPVDEIARYPLPLIAKQAVLFLWRVSAMQEEALFVCRAWGFKPYSELVWCKQTILGNRHFGMGHCVRAEHESCLIAVRGRLLKPAVKNVRSVITGPVREHSEKPEEFYDVIEELYPTEVKAELFARRTRPGWYQEGNQLGTFDGPTVPAGFFESAIEEEPETRSPSGLRVIK